MQPIRIRRRKGLRGLLLLPVSWHLAPTANMHWVICDDTVWTVLQVALAALQTEDCAGGKYATRRTFDVL